MVPVSLSSRSVARGAVAVGLDRNPECRPLERGADMALPSEDGNGGAGEGGRDKANIARHVIDKH